MQLCFFFASCNINDDLNNVDESSNEQGYNSEGFKVEDGHLSFSDMSSAKTYISNIQEKIDEMNKEGSNTKSAFNSISLPDGFNALAQMTQDNNSNTKSALTDEEEFNRELANQIIPDEVVHYVVDTTLKVEIGEELYQISPFGTFIYSPSDSAEYSSLQESFIDIYKDYTSQVDSASFMYGNIKFIDSYNLLAKAITSGKDIEDLALAELDGSYVPENEGEVGTSTLKSSSTSDDYSDSQYTKDYNLITYKAGAKTVVGKWLQKPFGANSWRERRLDNDRYRRIKVKLYDVDYGFYDNQGFRVEYNFLKDKTIKIWYFKRWRLRSKRVKLWSYWSTSETPSDMVVGIDHLSGYYKLDDPNVNKSIMTQVEAGRSFASNVANTSTDFIYQGYTKNLTDYAKNWADKSISYSGKAISFMGKKYPFEDLQDKAFDATVNAANNWLKNKMSEYINNALRIDKKWITTQEKRKAMSNAPVSIMLPSFDDNNPKLVVLLKGVHSYGKKQKVHVQFGSPSFGVSLFYNGK
ncbi:MAG: hypothetical protein ACK5L5_00395 [Bacteroidales bacterium]